MKSLDESTQAAAPQVHAILLEWQKRVVVANERRLGASLENPQHAEHIWQIRPMEYVFGTRVPYSRAHAKHRRERGMGDHMALPKEVASEIARVIAENVVGVR